MAWILDEVAEIVDSEESLSLSSPLNAGPGCLRILYVIVPVVFVVLVGFFDLFCTLQISLKLIFVPMIS